MVRRGLCTCVLGLRFLVSVLSSAATPSVSLGILSWSHVGERLETNLIVLPSISQSGPVEIQALSNQVVTGLGSC